MFEEELLALKDEKYGNFQSSLVPGVTEKIIGVRTPALRNLAKEVFKADRQDSFYKELPHEYFEQNQLHGFLISLEKDFAKTVQLVEDFLPYVNNWATCDQMGPKVFGKHKDELLDSIYRWIGRTDGYRVTTYSVRFGIKCLMEHFLNDDFKIEYLDVVSEIKSEEYYINMMIAWYFATALAKQWDAALPYISEHKLSAWCHKKTIQKAVESFRVSDEHKQLLKTFR